MPTCRLVTHFRRNIDKSVCYIFRRHRHTSFCVHMRKSVVHSRLFFFAIVLDEKINLSWLGWPIANSFQLQQLPNRKFRAEVLAAQLWIRICVCVCVRKTKSNWMCAIPASGITQSTFTKTSIRQPKQIWRSSSLSKHKTQNTNIQTKQ